MADHQTLTPIAFFLILAAGILPALLWLWFWLKEDKKNPEPRTLIILAFLVGAISILFAFPLESWVAQMVENGWWLFFGWALIEELLKLCAAVFATYHRKAFDEPIDYMIYLIAVAIGFAAFENTLFLLKSYYAGGLVISSMTGSMRFIGATLLHVLSSSFLGGFMALAYCKGRIYKIAYTLVGISVATFIHTTFNYFLIKTDNALTVFGMLWLGVVFLMLFFERIKRVVCAIPGRK